MAIGRYPLGCRLDPSVQTLRRGPQDTEWPRVENHPGPLCLFLFQLCWALRSRISRSGVLRLKRSKTIGEISSPNTVT